MTRLPPPLRFLAGTCAGWTCARAGILWMTAAGGGADHPFVSAPRPLARAGPAAVGTGSSPFKRPSTAAAASVQAPARRRAPAAAAAAQSRLAAARRSATPKDAPDPTPAGAPPSLGRGARAEGERALPVLPTPARLATPAARATGAAAAPAALVPAALGIVRPWSVSAWALIRRGAAAPLAPGGMLGGSQAGARGLYRLGGRNAPLALSLRVTWTLERPGGAEAAAGMDWKPVRRLPVHFLLERRQKLGGAGRSAFAAIAYGGGEARLGAVRIAGYGQAGLVGTARRDAFADAAVRAGLPVGPLLVGAGAWAAAQPGTARFDLGPHVEARLPFGSASAAVDWRFRVAGRARPGSGPALTLAADF
jgi:hypothetical protein